jgi:hypothetical protein
MLTPLEVDYLVGGIVLVFLSSHGGSPGIRFLDGRRRSSGIMFYFEMSAWRLPNKSRLLQVRVFVIIVFMSGCFIPALEVIGCLCFSELMWSWLRSNRWVSCQFCVLCLLFVGCSSGYNKLCFYLKTKRGSCALKTPQAVDRGQSLASRGNL